MIFTKYFQELSARIGNVRDSAFFFLFIIRLVPRLLVSLCKNYKEQIRKEVRAD